MRQIGLLRRMGLGLLGLCLVGAGFGCTWFDSPQESDNGNGMISPRTSYGVLEPDDIKIPTGFDLDRDGSWSSVQDDSRYHHVEYAGKVSVAEVVDFFDHHMNLGWVRDKKVMSGESVALWYHAATGDGMDQRGNGGESVGKFKPEPDVANDRENSQKNSNHGLLNHLVSNFRADGANPWERIFFIELPGKGL